MYGWIWRRLPGPLTLRVLIAALMVSAIMWPLFAYVFPWIDTAAGLGGTVAG